MKLQRKEYTPHPYQELITQHQLSMPRSATFSGMGTGKTVSTLTSLDINYLSGATSKPTLILAPLRVCNSVWPQEARKWNHLRNIDVVPVTGVERERLNALKRDVSVYACNYNNIPWLVDQYGSHWPFETIVADESTRLKSFRLRQGGVRAQALSKIAHAKVKRFMNLTGTPAPNGLQDLWGQMWMLDKGVRLGRSYTAFMDQWFCRTPDGYRREIRSDGHAQEIYNRIADLCLTIDPKDYFDLNDPIVKNVCVDLPNSARRIYNVLKKELVAQIENHTITAAKAAVKTQKLLQLANGAVYVEPDVEDDSNPKSKKWKQVHDAKLQALESIIYEANGTPVLVAYHFRSDLERIQKAFKHAVFLDGEPETLNRWNRGKIPILLAHPQSAGHGLNLQDGGNILVFFGHNWALEDRLQIIERIGPMRQKQSGHDRPTWIYNIIAEGTVDQVVISRVDTKKSVQDALLESMK